MERREREEGMAAVELEQEQVLVEEEVAEVESDADNPQFLE